MAAAFLAVRLAALAAALPYALDWRSPFLASVRWTALAALVVLPALFVLIDLRMQVRMRRRAGTAPAIARTFSALSLALSGLCLAWVVTAECRFLWIRHTVLRADPALLETLGHHVMVGYRDLDEIIALIDRRAVSGVFVTGRNIRGRAADQIRQDIAAMQERRRQQGLPPLLIATDQEGGIVSRLSPPLPRQPPLSAVASRASDPEERRKAVQAYADKQGSGLAGLGINLNFAPVVDLNLGVVNPDDTLTRIHSRAISADPAVVRDVADAYCSQLAIHRVRCTLKHFPGLGRVYADTHLEDAELPTPIAELSAADWVPFRSLMRRSDLFVMLGHARLTALDPAHPVSFSRMVVGDLLRKQWEYDGVLITDDFSMGAVTYSPEGIAGASVAALNAGVDLILVGYDVDQYYYVMDALLQGRRSGRLMEDALRDSRRRLEHALP